MPEAWLVIKNGLGTWRQNYWPGVLVSIVFLMCAATGLLLPPALFGLNEYAYQKMKGRTVSFATFWEAVLHYLGKSYLWAALNGVVIVLAWVNLRFYGDVSETLGGALQWFFTFLALIWLMMQMYFVPFVIQLTEENVWLALRNSFFGVLAFPIYALSLFVFSFFIAVTGSLVIIPLIMGLPLLLALIGQYAVQDRLNVAHQRMREQQEQAEKDAKEKAGEQNSEGFVE
jgi:hypothetical protein